MPDHVGGGGVQRVQRRHGIDLPFLRQQPGLGRALQRGFEAREFGQRQRAGLRRARCGPRQPRKNALRRAGIAAVRQQQTSALGEMRPCRQRRDDAAPQRDGAPAECRHFGRTVVELGQRAQHAGGGEACGLLTVEARQRPGRRVEHADTVAGPREPPRQQPTEQAGTSDADAELWHGGAASGHRLDRNVELAARGLELCRLLGHATFQRGGLGHALGGGVVAHVLGDLH